MDPALIAAAIGVGGTVVVGVAGFWANVRNTNKTTALALQGQVTDRFSKAIDHLGSEKLDVRIGGIYALERIARDSPQDHPTIMEVLAAFILDHSREQWPPAEDGAEPAEHRTRPDVQAAATVIGRRTVQHDSQPINLVYADLTYADLTGAHLAGAALNGANLTGALLLDADLTDANLLDADLTGAKLTSATLTDANISRANLTGANLWDAKLSGAFLTDADLTGADLTDADLTGAELTGAELTGAELTDVRWPSGTPPLGWVDISGRLARAVGNSGDATAE